MHTKPAAGKHSLSKKVVLKHQQGTHFRRAQDFVTCILIGAGSEAQSLVCVEFRERLK